MPSVFLALRHTDPPGPPKLFALATRIRLVTQWPHGGIVVGDDLMHATLADGLHISPFNNKSEWDLVRLPDYMTGIVLERFKERQGAQYDALSLLAFLVPWRVSDSTRMYCYEWCWYAMTGESPSFRVTPEKLLFLSEKLNKANSY